MTEPPDGRYLFCEGNTTATIDFPGLCSVVLEVDPESLSLYIKITGCDDRATILMDQTIDIPEPDEDE